jgi:hypothetical protein
VRRLLCALALAAAGCPLPQPLPAVGRTDGSRVAPPTILAGSASPAGSTVVSGAACPAGHTLAFSAVVEDADLEDTVEARWFVDYAPPANTAPLFTDFPSADRDGVDPRRALAPFLFEPARFAAGGMHHVVELVVSNGFYPENTPGVEPPERAAQPGYDTQVFRWFVILDPALPCP